MALASVRVSSVTSASSAYCSYLKVIYRREERERSLIPIDYSVHSKLLGIDSYCQEPSYSSLVILPLACEYLVMLVRNLRNKMNVSVYRKYPVLHPSSFVHVLHL
jgi:hypothetical protein